MSHENQSRELTSYGHLGVAFVLVAGMAFLKLVPPWNLWVAAPLAVAGLAIGVYGLWSWAQRGMALNFRSEERYRRNGDEL